jgi:AAHS family 4-hydroxybenzoate transporter-like MFS transporter
MKPVDIGSLLETGRSSSYAKSLVFLTALAVIFDGADIQLLAVAIPSLMKDWSLPRSAFPNVVAAGLIGMMIGGAMAGVVGDRLGRKAALLLSVLTFAVATLGMSAAQGLVSLGCLRFLAGLGLGGAMPNAAALAAEFVPRRQRTFTVTLTIVCVPIGGMSAGFLAGEILPVFGWRWLFLLGGMAPLVCLILLYAFLAESPRFLARHPGRWPELVRFLRRSGHEVASDASFTDSTEHNLSRASVGSLFAADFRRDTLALWIAFCACMLAVYAGFNWIPALLTGAGWQVAAASSGILYFNLGGVFGAVAASLVISRFGSKPTRLGMALGSVASGLVLSRLPISDQAPAFPVLAMLVITGGLINASMVSMYALAAHVYPTSVRATGVGAAVSVGRLGAVFSAGVGSWMLDKGGYPYFFTTMAGAMMLCFVSLAFIQRHTQRAGH